MVASPRDFFLGNLSQWEFDVPLQTQWAVRITPRTNVEAFLQNIETTITTDHFNFRLNSEIMGMLFGEDTQPNQDGIGLYFAQTITLPSEEISMVSESAPAGSGGFLGGSLGGDRMSGSRSINIDFLETNLDFLDGIIRPWIITASYNGLIELDPRQSIKANLELVQYTRGENRPIRKVHTFENCVPYSMQSRTLDYEDQKIIRGTVGWVFNHYYYRMMGRDEEPTFTPPANIVEPLF